MFTMLLLALADRADGRRAARLSSALAARHGAGLAALHVSGPLSRDAACVLALPDEAAQARARAGVEALLREVMPAGLTADVLHAAGFVHVEALKAARILGPDLLVLGGLDAEERCRRELASGPSGEAGTAALTAESANCPVLVVPDGAEIPAGPFLRILACVDPAGEPGASRALLTCAARLAAREGAELVSFSAMELAPGEPLPDQREMSGRITSARERLAFLSHGLPGAGRFLHAAGEGEAAIEILKQARERGADLLVLAPGRGAGAVVERVLAGARCPVLLVGPGAQTPAKG